MTRNSWALGAGAFCIGVSASWLSGNVVIGIINALLIVGGVIAIVMGLELNSAVKEDPRRTKHRHDFGPWHDVRELNHDGSTGRVFEQVHRCTSPSCRYTESRMV